MSRVLEPPVRVRRAGIVDQHRLSLLRELRIGLVRLLSDVDAEYIAAQLGHPPPPRLNRWPGAFVPGFVAYMAELYPSEATDA